MKSTFVGFKVSLLLLKIKARPVSCYVASGKLMGQSAQQYAKLSPLDRLECVKRLAYDWMMFLRPSECTLLLWLLSNTLLRGKNTGCYSLPQLESGVRKRDGQAYWCRGTGLSQRTLHTTIKRLKEKGLITTRLGDRGTIFTVNLNWSAEGTECVIEAAKFATDPCNTCNPSSSLQFLVDNAVTSPSPSAPPRTVAGMKEAVKEDREEKAKQNRSQGYQQTWNAAWKEGCFRRVAPGFTKKTGAMIAKVLKRDWPARFGDQHEMIRWCVLNWNAAVSAKMGWMTKRQPPTTPCPDFFAHFVRYFIDAYMDAETVRWIKALPRTQAQIEELVHQGMDREVAIFEVAKTQVLAAEREQLGRAQQQANQTLQLAKMMVARAKHAPRFTAENPHPLAESKIVHLPVKGDGDGSFDVGTLPQMALEDV